MSATTGTTRVCSADTRSTAYEATGGAAGIARSGFYFYFYFESKQALLAALTDQAIGEGDQEMAEWLASDGLDRAALRRGYARALARWRLEDRWLSEVFIAPDPGPDVRHVRIVHSLPPRADCEPLPIMF